MLNNILLIVEVEDTDIEVVIFQNILFLQGDLNRYRLCICSNVDWGLDIVPILVILLLSRLLIENKQLRDDNSLFI